MNMSILCREYEYERERVFVYVPAPGFVTFVAKIQKAKTRKNKDYFVLRATVPKDVAEKIDAQPGDYLFFKTKKAEWYHMLDWGKMEATWQMLPNEIKNRAILEGLTFPGATGQMAMAREALGALGSTNPSATCLAPMQQAEASKQI